MTLVPVAVAVTVTVVSAAVAPQGAWAQSAEELYTDYFGCWTCHGPRGQGGDGQPLRGTYLPLSMFIKALRLPAGEMPPFSDLLATDAELAAVYVYLEGADSVAEPLPVELTLVNEEESWASSGGELSLTTRLVEPRTRVRLRMTLMSRDDSMVADQPFEVRDPATGERAPHQTDRYGQAEWVAGEGMTLVRLALPVGHHALVVEALDPENPDGSTILGVGSTVIHVE